MVWSIHRSKLIIIRLNFLLIIIPTTHNYLFIIDLFLLVPPLATSNIHNLNTAVFNTTNIHILQRITLIIFFCLVEVIVVGVLGIVIGFVVEVGEIRGKRPILIIRSILLI